MKRSMEENRQTCNTCGGSGEIGYFRGESRFVITREECPACCGFGYTLEDEDHASGGTEDDTDNDEE